MIKPLKISAWTGLISLILSILAIPLMFLTQDAASKLSISFFISLVGFICGVLFLNGFLVLAKKFNNPLLTVMTWIGIAFAILALLFSLIGGIVTLATNVGAQELTTGTDLSSQDSAALAALVILLIIWIPLSLFMGTYSILFGVGILRMKGKVKYAKPAGVLNIVAGATYIILIGLLVMIVAYVFEIMMLFSASKKFER